MAEATYERTDANTRAIWITIGVIAVTIALILLTVHGLMVAMTHIDRPLRVPRNATAAPTRPPDPQIQGIPSLHPTTPRQDMAAYVADQRRILTTYAPTTQPGYARIPISRAIDLMVSKTAGGTDEKR